MVTLVLEVASEIKTAGAQTEGKLAKLGLKL